MFYLSSVIEKLNIQATDGELGGVRDLYFDDQYWTVRYLVVDTRKWLPGKKVLLSPISFDHVDMENNTVNVFATKETVKNAPHQLDDAPVSKQTEQHLANYYGWPTYWSGLGLGAWGGYDNPYAFGDAYNNGLIQNNVSADDLGDDHLRSTNHIKGDFTGYRIEALDGEIGHVSDFAIDETNWKIEYLVVETRNWLLGEFVLIATGWVKEINWEDKKVLINLTKEQVKQGAELDPDSNRPIIRHDEEQVYASTRKQNIE
ncbi:PRC-barrel domain-containing protein [Terrihalobacillus insolitus]|uniref:PRC-barrel domain-containing protein n=1 Tax=Terrihalobacillus insolitus TaxID=2950438 RepID=UPI002FEDF4F6